MAFCDKLAAGIPTLSYEFSPPKNPADWATLYSTLGQIARQAPDFVSVTYGAGGSNREKTVDLVSRIERELDIEAVPHLTCVGHSKDEICEILTTLQAAGINHLMALRGDAPKNDPSYQPHTDGFTHASELIEYAEANFDFHVGCAFYPEKHPDAAHIDEDVSWLRFKQESGAEFATSQLFFDNAVFYGFRERAARAGVTFPLLAGVLPVTSLGQIARIAQLSGQEISPALLDALGSGTDAEVQARGIEYALRQCRDLLENGVAGVHLYTFNRTTAAVQITKALRAEGFFPVTRKPK